MATMNTVWLTFVAIAMTSGSNGMKVVGTYRDVYGDRLLTMDLEKESGTLLVGSTMTLTKLNENLDFKEILELEVNHTNLNNIVIDSESDSVILCSGEVGKCDIRSLKDMKNVLSSNPNHLVTSFSDLKSVILLSSKYKRLFIANNFNADENLSDYSVPVLSSRRSDKLFISHIDSTGSSAKYIRNNYLPPSFFVMFLYAFTEQKYVYFISRQPNSQNSAVTSKISRLCLDDLYFRSYIEIQIDCVADSSTQYSLAQSAHYDTNSEELFVSFMRGTSLDSSAVCSFNLRDINKMMDNTVRDCYQGNGFYGPVHLHKTSSCIPTVCITKTY